MRALVIVGLLLVLGSSLEVTSSWTVSGNSQRNQNLYDLGTLAVGDIIKVSFILPGPDSTQKPRKFKPRILDSGLSNTGLMTGNVLTSGSPKAVEKTAGAITSPGQHYLHLVLPNSQIGIRATKVVLISVRKNNADLPYLALADFLRNKYGNIFYFNTTRNIRINTSPSYPNKINVFRNGLDGISTIQKYKTINNDNPIQFDNQPQGYYRINYGDVSNPGTHTSTFYTDPHHCPYPSGYIDIYNVFAGCTPNPSVSGQLINQHAARAIQAHGCGVRQYFNDGCKNVDPSCNTFDQLSGWCTTCADTSITPNNGKCASPSTAISCPDGQHQVDSACIPNTCSAADAAGQCTACVSVIYEVVSGACVKKTCGEGFDLNSQTGNCEVICPQGQQKVGQSCHIVPANCLGLTSALHCSQCTDPLKYALVGGFCQLCSGSHPLFPCVQCTNQNQIVSSSGSCVVQNPFCATVDQSNGHCLTCLSGQAPNNGFCCPQGSALATGVCPSITSSGGSLTSEPGSGPRYRFCQIFDLVLNRCKTCKEDYVFAGSSDLCVSK